MTRSTTERGYGAAHQAERERWAKGLNGYPSVEAGEVNCHATRCLHPDRWIQPGTPWDLGHTLDRTHWTGPEHADCNRSDGGRRSHQPPPNTPPQRRWNL